MKYKWSTGFVLSIAMFSFMLGWWRGERLQKMMDKIECKQEGNIK